MKVNIYSFKNLNDPRNVRRYVMVKDDVKLRSLLVKPGFLKTERYHLKKVIELKEHNTYIGLMDTKKAMDELNKNGYYFVNCEIENNRQVLCEIKDNQSLMNDIFKFIPSTIPETKEPIPNNSDINKRLDKMEKKIDKILELINSIHDGIWNEIL